MDIYLKYSILTMFAAIMLYALSAAVGMTWALLLMITYASLIWVAYVEDKRRRL